MLFKVSSQKEDSFDKRKLIAPSLLGLGGAGAGGFAGNLLNKNVGANSNTFINNQKAMINNGYAIIRDVIDEVRHAPHVPMDAEQTQAIVDAIDMVGNASHKIKNSATLAKTQRLKSIGKGALIGMVPAVLTGMLLNKLMFNKKKEESKK